MTARGSAYKRRRSRVMEAIVKINEIPVSELTDRQILRYIEMERSEWTKRKPPRQMRMAMVRAMEFSDEIARSAGERPVSKRKNIE